MLTVFGNERYQINLRTESIQAKPSKKNKHHNFKIKILGANDSKTKIPV
jgi:hypothetical protein